MDREIIKQIKKDVAKRNFNDSMKPFPKKGRHMVEFGHKCAMHPEFDDLYFVIGKQVTYNNRVIVDTQWTVYAYTSEGTFIEDFDPSIFEEPFYKNLTFL